MSVFSGKCDFYDGFVMIHNEGDEKKIEEALKRLKLYITGNDGRSHRVKSDTIKDIAKYYPYLECFMSGDKDGYTVAILHGDSFIDDEEEEYKSWYIKDALKYWRKCKRNKTTFTAEDCYEKINHWGTNEPVLEICKRIEADGDKAEFDDIHFPMWEWYRRKWFDELVRLGWSEQQAYNWCFKGFFDSRETEEKRLGRPIKR